MKPKDIPFHRLTVQQISASGFTKVKDLVSYMGAIQSQDYRMAKLAIGLRVKDADEQLVDKAIIDGDIVRTHILRPTWHFVSSDDLYWMLELTASRIKTSMKGRNRQLELNPAIFQKSNKIMSKALAGGNHMTRNELVKLLNNSKIKTDLNRASHLFAEAELSGLICSGKPKGTEQTYALVAERVKSKRKISREEALAKLAGTYVRSRGPASVKDFSWWSGLNLTDAKTAVELVSEEFPSFSEGTKAYWYDHVNKKIEPEDKLYLLPSFDEYLIAYTDRSAVLTQANAKKYVTLNGMFFPIIVFRGEVIGIWQRKIKSEFVDVDFNFFGRVTKKIRKLAEIEAGKLADFLNKELRLLR